MMRRRLAPSTASSDGTKDIEYEADPRQAESVIDECGLRGAEPMSIPGVKNTFQEYEADVPLEKELHTPFRNSSARSNYL